MKEKKSTPLLLISGNRLVRVGPVILSAIILCLCLVGGSMAEIGSFLLSGRKQKEKKGVVSLSDLSIEVDIRGGFARVCLRQTFQNNSDRQVKGSYYLKLPADASLMNFGMWEDGRWTDAVIIERKRGKRAFNQLVQRKIDPALMEAPEAEITDAFKIAVAPIPPYSTRRLETTYHHWLKVRSQQRRFLLPLKPGEADAPETAKHCRIKINVSGNLPLGELSLQGPSGASFQTKRKKLKANGEVYTWQAEYEGGPLKLDRDLFLVVPIDISKSRLSLFSYRDVETESLDLSATGGKTYKDERGYFLAEAVYNLPDKQEEDKKARDVVILIDTSLSMQMYKLRQAARVAEEVLAGLGDNDGFTILTMDKEIAAWRKTFKKVEDQNKKEALAFLYNSPLRAGTRLDKGFTEALEIAKEGGRAAQVVAVTDGQATLDEIKHAELIESIRSANEQEGKPIPVHVFGIGEDTNVPLLKKVSSDSGGYFIWARQTEDIRPKLFSFLDGITDTPLMNVSLSLDPGKGIEFVYPAEGVVGFNHESISWTGRYHEPAKPVTARVTAKREDREVSLASQSALPEKSTDHQFVRRLWAERRVGHLLERIRMEGEKEEWIEEIIFLSRKFKFPTPYTSYLVAPRAFLRPRRIRPRDPVLRVKTEPGTRSVVTLFPFGETRELRYISSDKVWETRFLVPEWMDDGKYWCRLIITGTGGEKRMEYKHFIVDSTPPTLDVRAKGPVRPGEAVEIYVDADPDTRWIRARLDTLPPVEVRWDPVEKINRGRVLIPPSWPRGEYEIRFTAEDFAHNNAGARTTVRVGG